MVLLSPHFNIYLILNLTTKRGYKDLTLQIFEGKISLQSRQTYSISEKVKQSQICLVEGWEAMRLGRSRHA